MCILKCCAYGNLFPEERHVNIRLYEPFVGIVIAHDSIHTHGKETAVAQGNEINYRSARHIIMAGIPWNIIAVENIS